MSNVNLYRLPFNLIRLVSGLLEPLGVFVLLVGLWWYVTEAQLVSRFFLPSPLSTWISIENGLLAGDLLTQTISTVWRMLVGWAMACLGGVALGVLIGISESVRSWISSTLEFVRPMPASAILPLAISIFGLSGEAVLFVVAFGAMWPVLLATLHGLGTVHSRLQEVGRALEMSNHAVIWKIGIPNALPDILAGARLSMTVSLIVSVVGEMVASQSGLGQSVILAARSFRANDLFAGIILLGLIGFLSNFILSRLEKRLLAWQVH